ncbi:hypothetical protein, partial [Celerinatantimonas sp. MCCC 1A17872]|uniref:hypothetical protein n=1 Tax=Celerinatantimonas sp. MCCC 1A17872 TaxID=3177514 RepID=UPI0038C79BEB
MNTFLLLINGKAISKVSSEELAAFKINAVEGAKFALVDLATGKFPDYVQMTNFHDSLNIYIHGKLVVVVNEFFDTSKHASLDTHVSYDMEQVQDLILDVPATENLDAAIDEASSQDASSEVQDGSSSLFTPSSLILAGVTGLIGGGIGYAAGDDNSDSGSSSATSTNNESEAISFALADDTGSSDSDSISNDATINVELSSDAASWVYSTDGGETWTTGSGTSFDLDEGTYAAGEIEVRQFDDSGNMIGTTATNSDAITIDTTAPDAPSSLSYSTSNLTVTVTLSDSSDSWEYSTDGGDTWTDGSGTSFVLDSNTTYAADAIQVRETDTAGNVSTVTSNDTAVTASADTLTVSVAAGTFISTVEITVYDADGNVLDQTDWDYSSGDYVFTNDTDYSGNILVVVSDANGDDADYIDETTGEEVSLGSTTLSAMYSIGSDDDSSTLSVTPLTELAATLAGVTVDSLSSDGLSDDQVSYNSSVAELFNLSSITSEVSTTSSDSYDSSDGTDDSEAYGSILAILSALDESTGSVSDTISALVAELTTEDDGSLSLSDDGLSLLEAAITNYNNSVSSTGNASVSTTTFDDPEVSVSDTSISADESLVFQSTQTGTAYLVSTSVTVDDSTDLATVATASQTITASGVDTTFSLDDVTDGTYVLYVENYSGDISAASSAITIDTTAPTATATTDNSVITVSSDEAGDVYVVASGTEVSSVSDLGNSMGKISADGTLDVTKSTDGTYDVYVVDSAGNISDAITVTVDTTAPTATATAADDVITVTSDEAGDVYVVASGTDVSSLSDLGDSVGTITADGTLDITESTDGSYDVYVVDAAGNISSAVSVTVEITSSDTTAPDATATVADDVITVSSDEAGDVYVVTSGTDISDGVSALGESVGTITADGTLDITELTDGSYDVYVVDASGNISSAATVTVDTTAPTAGAMVDDDVITVSSDEAGDVYVVASGTEFTSDTLSSFTSVGTITADGTLDINESTDGSYDVYVVDAVGNISSESTVTVDTTAPTSGATVADDVITVSSNEAGDVYVVTSGTDISAGISALGDSVGTITADGTLDITDSTDGSYDVYVVDASGNISTAASVTVDTTAPDATATVADDVITVSSDEAGDVYVVASGTEFTSDTLSTFTSAGTITADGTLDINESTDGSYDVYVVDASGNISTAASVTVDTTAPTAGATVADDVITVSSNEAGDVYVVASGTEFTSETLSSFSSVDTITANGTLEINGSADGSYDIYIVDAAGNISSAASVTVDTTAPTLESVSTSGDEITLISSEDGTVYIVASSDTTYSDKDSLEGVAITSVSVSADISASVSVTDDGSYDIYIVDESGNVSARTTITTDSSISADVSDDVITVTSTVAGDVYVVASGTEFTSETLSSFSSVDTITANGSLDITESTDGTYDVYVVDSSNTISSAATVTVDTTAPTATATVDEGVITVTSDEAGYVYLVSSGTDISAGISALGDSVGTIKADGTLDISESTNGSYDVYIVDSDGNISDAVTVTVDTTAPTAGATVDDNVITVTSDKAGDVYVVASGSDVSSLSDLGSSVGTITADGTLDITESTDGSYDVYVVDAAGNISSAATVTVDTTAPTAGATVADNLITVSSNEAGDVYVVASGTDISAGISALGDSEGTITANGTLDISESTDGSYDIYVVDAAGNISSAATVTVDTTAPTLESVSTSGDEITLTSSEDGTVYIVASSDTTYSDKDSLEAVAVTSVSVSADISASVSVTDDGSYDIYLVDESGNVSAVTTITTDSSISADVSDGVITVTSAVAGAVYVVPSGTSVSSVADLGTSVGTIDADGSLDFTESTDGTYDVYVVDSSNTISSAATVTVDTSPATASATVDGDVITVSSNEAGDVYVVAGGSDVSSLSDLGDSVGTITANGTLDITESTDGSYDVYVVDAAGNISSAATVTVDTTAPTAGATVADDVITVSSNEAGDVYVVASGMDISAGISALGDSEGTITANGTLDISESTDGSYDVYVVDAAGNISSAATVTVDTSPATVSATVDGDVITVSSNEAGDVYVVASGSDVSSLSDLGNSVGTITANGTFDITESTDGSYDVYVVDASGNISSAYSVTIDTTDPEFDGTSPDDASYVNSDSISFSSNETGIAYLVTSEYTSLSNVIDAAGDNYITISDADSTYSFNGLADGTYYIYLVDSSNNISEALEVTVDTTAPTISSAEVSGTTLTVETDTNESSYTVYVVDASDTVYTDDSLNDLIDAEVAKGTVSDGTGTLTGLADGTYDVYVVDAAGNVTEWSSSVTVDETGPTINDVTVSSATLTVDTDTDESSYTVYVVDASSSISADNTLSDLQDAAVAMGTVSDGTGTISGLADGTYDVYVVDAAGNVTEYTDSVTVSAPDIIDVDTTSSTFTVTASSDVAITAVYAVST